MSLGLTQDRLRLPESLQAQLHDFRRRVWSVKLIEAGCAAGFALVVSFLVLFTLDRLVETPDWLRAALFAAVLAGAAVVPLALHRWVWRQRRLEQLARLLCQTQPSLGDQLLGIIELVKSESEQARSRTLCEAAIRQVADEAQTRDFSGAVPRPRHRQWAWLFAVPAVAAVVVSLAFHTAAANTWTRLLEPWRPVPRYTFAAIEPLPARMVVPHGEPFAIEARLGSATVWRPRQGAFALGEGRSQAAPLRDGRYTFGLPALLEPAWVRMRIGDWVGRVYVEPKLRPELTSVVADVRLPEYLGRPQAERKDVRGGAVTLVKGSRANFAATANRKLRTAEVDGRAQVPAGAVIAARADRVDASRTMEFRWRDAYGLAGKAPFTLAINGRDDEPPTLICDDLPRQRVVLDTEQLSFHVRAQDDFGVKRVGLEWRGADDEAVKHPAKGERILAAGAHDKEMLELGGTFSARALGIEPQPLQVRLFAEDYLPGRGRAYSPPFTLYVLDAAQHAIWLTEQLSKWHRQSLEVRDREMQLHETNKQLRALTSEELDRPETRRRIENQAAAEQANGRRLSALSAAGDELIRQAMRNPEFAIGNLEKWAEMLQILKDIAGSRMPSVADLLKQAAQAPTAAATPSNRGPMAGQIRASGGGKPSKPAPGEKRPQQAVPQVVDRESSQRSPESKASDSPPSESKPKPARLTLPVTTLDGKPSDKPDDKKPPAEEAMEQAVAKQRDLLAEFDKIADELNRVLANLEGSTLVKRLKAASREQYKIAGRLGGQLNQAFGLPPVRVAADATKTLEAVAEQEYKGSQNVSLIMDDMQAYFERRKFMEFKGVLDDMRKLDAVGSLRQIGDDLKREHGLSVAQCEFWSDTLDRWAEDLVGACNCKCDAKSSSSLPPALVLEVLLILESEVNLREETRVAEQARAALEALGYKRDAHGLSWTQTGIHDRVRKVIEQIHELPDGAREFRPEIALLGKVAAVMAEAAGILDRPETGAPAIAAETEAIELLLMSKRINPKAGGGGGASPGGGSGGTTQDSALALVGGGVNDKEVREDRGVAQATGDAGPSLPEEFRAGLDEYFNRLERRPGR